MNLGISPHHMSFIYEGESGWGNPLLPPPIIVPVSFFSAIEPQPKVKKTNEVFQHVFREDSYDPVSRIRRGRIYHVPDNVENMATWYVTPHPLQQLEQQKIDSNGVIPRTLHSYWRFSLTNYLKTRQGEQLLLALGAGESFTIWSLVSIETSMNGDEIVTLRARTTFGSLPALKKSRIPSSALPDVIQALEKLSEDIFRAGPESVIDRARDAAAVILSAYVQVEGIAGNGLDLGELVKKISNIPNEKRKHNVINATDIVRRLHSRAKSSEQEKRSEIRRICEQDAEFAVQCIGSILCDLSWAEWR